MAKPWERPKKPDDEEPEEEETPEMARAMQAYYRKLRVFFFFFVCPAIGVGCVLVTWAAVGSGRPMPTDEWFFVMAVVGPAALWITAVRLVLSAMMMGDDELRTEEEDERQRRLREHYIQPGGMLDWIGLGIGLAHLGLVVLSF